MCGRFWQTKPSQVLKETFQLDLFPDKTLNSFNIAPTQTIDVIISTNNARQMIPMRWGLIPHWAKDPSIGNKMINARMETLAQKVSFKHLLKGHRCIIPSTGFFEWKSDKGHKTPYAIQRIDGKPLAFAGLWSTWQSDKDHIVQSCTIITTAANEIMQPIHHRMPVMLDDSQIEKWLAHNTTDIKEIISILQPIPSALLQAHPIGTFVNNPSNNSDICIKEVKK